MKNFVKTFMTLSMFVLCIGLTSCYDTVPEADEVTISIKEGVATENSISFTITSEGATSGVYWVYKASEPIELNISDGMMFTVNTETEVVVENLTPGTRYNINAYAKNLVNEATTKTISMVTLEETPTPVVKVDFDSNSDITATSATFAVTLTNAEEAAWVVSPMGDDMTADEIFANGTKIVPTQWQQSVVQTKEGLTPNTQYDMWVAAKNGTKVCEPVLKTFTTKAE
ncbi:MAG: hypothetical protein IJ348_01820 [Alistipes sp.]|nr:hypothetical protein [Alistipes sp.]